MGLETVTYINDLNSAWPIGATDVKGEGDNHLRNIKAAVKATFPNITGAMTLTHTVINALPADIAAKATQANAVMDGDAAGGVLSGTYPNPGFAVDMATQSELDVVAAAYGLRPLATYNASNSPLIDVTGLALSSYDTILIYGRGIIPAANGGNLRCRFGTGAGPTWVTAAEYDWVARGLRSNAVSNDGAVDSDTSIGLTGESTNGVGYITSSSGPGDCNFDLVLQHPNNTAVYKSCGFKANFNSSTDNRYVSVSGDGRWRGTTAITAIRFYFSNGNIQAGAFDVYGIKKP